MADEEKSTRASLPSANFLLHNYNLKYFLIRQMLEKKDVDEITTLHEQHFQRGQLQMQQSNANHF
jgi:hypothetical protein